MGLHTNPLTPILGVVGSFLLTAFKGFDAFGNVFNDLLTYATPNSALLVLSFLHPRRNKYDVINNNCNYYLAVNVEFIEKTVESRTDILLVSFPDSASTSTVITILLLSSDESSAGCFKGKINARANDLLDNIRI